MTKKLLISNSHLSKFYFSSNNHKARKSMHSFVSDIGASSYYIAKWFTMEFDDFLRYQMIFVGLKIFVLYLRVY